MSLVLPTVGTPKDPFKFWDTKPGAVFKWVGGATLVVGLYFALPILITLVTNLFTFLGFAIGAVVLSVVLGFLFTVITNEKFQLAFTVFAENIARRAFKLVVDSDPIGSARTALARMRKRLDEIKLQERKISTNLKRVEQQMQENKEQADEKFRLAQRATQQGKKSQAEVQAMTAQELIESNRALEPVYKQMRMYAQIFAKVAESSETRIEFFANKISIKEKEFAVKRAGQEAAASARRMFKGPEGDLMRESMESISDQIAAAEADMEQFLTEVMPTLQADELKRGVNAERSMESLQKWLSDQNQKSDTQSLIPSGEARTLLLEAGGQPLVLPNTTRESLPAVSTDSLDSFFESK